MVVWEEFQEPSTEKVFSRPTERQSPDIITRDCIEFLFADGINLHVQPPCSEHFSVVFAPLSHGNPQV